jgi:peptide/nickel transport system ATP-binding protein
MAERLLEVQNATKIYGGGFFGSHDENVALRDFNLAIPEKPATIVTIAGESGSGKTTLANAILGFVPLTSGKILYKGRDVTALSKRERLDYWREVQAIFQDPYEVYNPFYRVRHTFDQVLRRFRLADSSREAEERIEGALRAVGLGREVLEKYPHQLSGGQRQRIMIARAYTLNPRLIVADEPVSMVDASLRAMILDIMTKLRDKMQISFLYITHDLSTAYQISDEILILYSGIVAERGETTKVIENPKHPYVRLLVSSVPVPDPDRRWERDVVLSTEDDPTGDADQGCPYYPRCPHRMDRCLEALPALYSVNGTAQQAACYLYESKQS